MAEVEDSGALLLMALRDLHDAEMAMAGRSAKLHGDCEDGELRGLIAEDGARSERQAGDLAEIARSLGAEPHGPANIWLRAILDDADNDARTIAAGPLRDIALVGALRKAKQSERVSYETALALAEAMALDEAAETLRIIRDEEAAADEALAGVLVRLCAGQ